MADLQVGSEFAGCRIEAVAGRGGMGVIYRATDLSLGRPVAVKLIAAEYAANREFRERFSREARLTAAIDHPNVIPVYAAGEEDDRLYLVMRYVSGTDLHHLLATAGRLEPTRAAAIITQVAAGLDAAHAAGLVHRDVKPANVLITGEAGSEHVYLSDFGITRLEDSETHITDSGEWVGTVDYMAPEHLEAHRTDARSDVYSLGGVLYTALTGAPPFRRGSTAATILAHLKDQPPLPSLTTGVPAAFDAVVARGMAKSPADRFASAGDLAIAALAAAGTLDDLSATEKEKSVARGDAAPPSDRSRRVASPASSHSRRRPAPASKATKLASLAQASFHNGDRCGICGRGRDRDRVRRKLYPKLIPKATLCWRRSRRCQRLRSCLRIRERNRIREPADHQRAADCSARLTARETGRPCRLPLPICRKQDQAVPPDRPALGRWRGRAGNRQL
ncbi:MAG: serine/threonine-protein kinase [Solirubrobacterales bacterium]|nr:serine/threonine-protein kinase [Solirubrobacterales bacterium]